MRADIRSLRIALLLIGALSAAGAAGESKGSPADGIAKLFDEIDEDGDGRVAIAEFSRALGMDLKGTDLRARMLVASLDANADQQISRKEADDGAARMVAMSVSRLMALDVDGDEALSRQEYALGVPDPKGKPGDDGLTERQRDGFEHLDAGGDGKVTRAEVEVHAREQAASTLKEMRVAGRCLAVADQDRDGRISKEEFVRIAGETSADQFAALNPGSAGLGRRELLRWVTTQTKEERAKLLTRLDVQESRLEMRAAAAAFFESADLDKSGTVAFDELSKGTGTEGDDGQRERFQMFDADGDAAVSRDELMQGLEAMVAQRFVARPMTLDANQDGALSPTEFALGSPEPEGKPDQTGLTPAQKAQFAANDRDGDGRVTPLELELQARRWIAGYLDSQRLLARVFGFDTNGNGILEFAEFARFRGYFGDARIAPVVRDQFAAWSHEQDGKPGISRQDFEAAFAESPRSERRRIEHTMRALEEYRGERK